MALDNLISVVFTDEDVAKIDAALSEIEKRQKTQQMAMEQIFNEIIN